MVSERKSRTKLSAAEYTTGNSSPDSFFSGETGPMFESGGSGLKVLGETEVELESGFGSMAFGAAEMEFGADASNMGLRFMQAGSCVIKIVNKINR